MERRLLPSGILELPIQLNGKLAYVFQDDDGTDVVHFIGEFMASVGDGEGQELRSREAVVWIIPLRLNAPVLESS